MRYARIRSKIALEKKRCVMLKFRPRKTLEKKRCIILDISLDSLKNWCRYLMLWNRWDSLLFRCEIINFWCEKNKKKLGATSEKLGAIHYNKPETNDCPLEWWSSAKNPLFLGYFRIDPEVHFRIDPETPLKPKSIRKPTFGLILGPILGHLTEKKWKS